MTNRFTTGGGRSTDAPGQTTPGRGGQAPNSVVQDAEPDDVLRVIKQPRKCAIIISPFMAEDYTKASQMSRYSIRAVKDSLSKMEAPLANHAFYHEALNVRNPIERDIGLLTNLSWMKAADLVAVYVDFGITPAMQVAINAAMLRNKRIEYRTIGSYA